MKSKEAQLATLSRDIVGKHTLNVGVLNFDENNLSIEGSNPQLRYFKRCIWYFGRHVYDYQR